MIPEFRASAVGLEKACKIYNEAIMRFLVFSA